MSLSFGITDALVCSAIYIQEMASVLNFSKHLFLAVKWGNGGVNP